MNWLGPGAVDDKAARLGPDVKTVAADGPGAAAGGQNR